MREERSYTSVLRHKWLLWGAPWLKSVKVKIHCFKARVLLLMPWDVIRRSCNILDCFTITGWLTMVIACVKDINK